MTDKEKRLDFIVPKDPSSSSSSSPPPSPTEDKLSANLLTRWGKFSVVSYSASNTLLYIINNLKFLQKYVEKGVGSSIVTAVIAGLGIPLCEMNLRGSGRAVALYQARDDQEREEAKKKIKSQYPIKNRKVLKYSAIGGGIEKAGGVVSSTDSLLDAYTGSFSDPSKFLILPVIAYTNLVAAVAISSPEQDKKNSYLPLRSPEEEQSAYQKLCSGIKKTHALLVNVFYSTSNTFLYLPDTQKLLSDVMKSMRDWFPSSGDRQKQDWGIELGALISVTALAVVAWKANYSSTSAALRDLHGLPDETQDDKPVNPFSLQYEKVSRDCLALLKSLGLTASLWGFFESVDPDLDMHPGLRGLFYTLTALSLVGNLYTNRAFASRGLQKSDVRDELNTSEYTYEDESEDSSLINDPSIVLNHAFSGRDPSQIHSPSRPLIPDSFITSSSSLSLTRDASTIQSSSSTNQLQDRVVSSGDWALVKDFEDPEDGEDPKELNKSRCIVL